MPFFLPVNPMTYNVQKAAWRKLKYFSSTASLLMANPLKSSHPPANTSSGLHQSQITIPNLNIPKTRAKWAHRNHASYIQQMNRASPLQYDKYVDG